MRGVENPEAGWLIASDNPNSGAWLTQEWPTGEIRSARCDGARHKLP